MLGTNYNNLQTPKFEFVFFLLILEKFKGTFYLLIISYYDVHLWYLIQINQIVVQNYFKSFNMNIFRTSLLTKFIFKYKQQNMICTKISGKLIILAT